MFFRHSKPKQPTFEDRLNGLKQFGFTVSREANGRVRASKGSAAAILEDLGEGKVAASKAGVVAGDEIAHLVHGGYQMFLRTASGKEFPALAMQLKELHAFTEDLREGLGLTSLYNLALGTIADDHLYDRVADRDARAHPKPWEKKIAAQDVQGR